jgi:transcription antitermination factor NusG
MSGGLGLDQIRGYSENASDQSGHWYAVHTSSRCEKSVAAHLASKSIEHLLPLCDTVRRWRNGRHRVQLPLFPGYLFARLDATNRVRALQVPGLAYIVGSRGYPTPMQQEEIDRLMRGLQAGIVMEPYPYMTVGTRVEVRGGPFEGATGFVIRRRGKTRVIISIDLIMRAMAIEVDAEDLSVTRRTEAISLPSQRPILYPNL